ncbi:MAG: hypothetical protein LBT22_06760 [Peptococcaceae bacterium]|jgi:hypothetical protein|nr:hypothetical protein [Peptococcaceae bacterium]
MLKKVGASIVFLMAILTMLLPFYGFKGVSNIPGIAAILDHKILLSPGEMAVFSNIPVFVIAILLYYFCLWGDRNPGRTNRSGVALQVLAVMLIEIGKWEYLLRFEHSIGLSLWGFWLNSALNLIVLLLCLPLKKNAEQESIQSIV